MSTEGSFRKTEIRSDCYRDYELGDGNITQVEVFTGKITWFDEERLVDLIFTKSEQSLIGTGLLTKCRLEVNYPEGEVFIQRIA